MATRNVSLDRTRYTKGGVALREINLNEAVLDSHFGTRTQFTVVSQSVAPGTTLVRGGTVDVTMAVTGTLPVAIFQNVPVQWQAIPIRDVAEKVRRDPQILQLLATHDSASSMNEAETRLFLTFMDKNGLTGGGQVLNQGFDVARNSHLMVGE